MDLAIKFVVNAIALLVAVNVVPRLKLDLTHDLVRPAVVVLIFAVVNTYLRPIVKILSLPFTLISLGIVGFVINAALFMLVGWISGQLNLGLSIAGWPRSPLGIDVLVTAFLAAIVMGVVATIASVALMGRRLLRM